MIPVFAPKFGLAGVIAGLFSAGEQGVWYDPSDMSTMFQDAAGTTPVTAVEQPVGLILDKSRGLVLGAEVVANGTFDSGAAGWSAGANAASVSASAGRLTVVSVSAGFGRAVTTISLTAGRTYKVEAEVTSTNCSAVGVGVSGNAQGTGDTGVLTLNAVGKKTAYFVAASTGYLTLRNSDATPNGATTWESVSVRELLGNHATQTTATSRPVLSARVNLLTKTEQFDDAAWTKVSGAGDNPTITQNTAIAPNGTMTAATYTQVSTANTSRIYQSVNLPSGVAHKHVMHVKKNVGRWAYLAGMDGALTNGFHAWFDLDTGQVGSSSAIGAGTFVSANITSVENGFYRIEVFGSVASTSVNACWFYVVDANNSTTRLPGGSAFIWGADSRATNMGIGLPAYQRVNTATDYDTAGFPMYLRFDGVDDWLVTPSINFTATDKMTVFAGVRKLSSVSGIIVEHTSGGEPFFHITASGAGAGSPDYNFLIYDGAAYPARKATTFTAPITNVISCNFDFSGASIDTQITPRVNSGAPTLTNSGIKAMPRNFTNNPLYIGRRAGTTFPFNGHIYSLIVRGAQSTAQQIASAEAWVNQRTGAY